MRSITFLLALTFFLAACGGKEESKQQDENSKNQQVEQKCTWRYDDASTVEVHWTVYKTTARVPVNGQFREVKLVTGPPKESFAEYLKSVKFEIPVAGTITGDAARDAKIIKFFFGSMAETESIIGSAQTVSGDDRSGTANFTVSMNGVTKEVPLSYTFNNGQLLMKGKLNVDDWNGQTAMKTLNEACKEKHTGKDGKTYVAPEIDLQISANLSCQK